MSKESKQKIESYLSQDIRFDGRGLHDFRDIIVEYNVSNTSEGSARVKIGDTEVIAGVKLEVGAPFPDTPDEGALMVGTELLPLSSPNFESGPPGIESIEIARVVDRGLRESKAVDYKKLCITKGEKVWIISVDICTINDDGNILDAAGLAAIAALKVTKFPSLVDEKPDYKKMTKENVPLSKIPILVTVYKINNKFIVDPSRFEDKEYDARLTITTIEDGTLCALQKGGVKPITAQDVKAMMEIATKKAKEIRKKL